MTYQELPHFERHSTYSVDIGWDYLIRWMTKDESGLNDFDLDPDFQRGLVWSEDKKRSYVEYILMGGVGSRDIYFNCTTWNDSYDTPVELVDGKQRMHAVLDYLNGQLSIFDGLYFKDIEGRMPLQARFTVHINILREKKKILQWYLDLNSGGVAHTDTELTRVRALMDDLPE